MHGMKEQEISMGEWLYFMHTSINYNIYRVDTLPWIYTLLCQPQVIVVKYKEAKVKLSLAFLLPSPLFLVLKLCFKFMDVIIMGVMELLLCVGSSRL